MLDGDHVLRAITEDGAFRVIAVRTTTAARGVADAQHATGGRALLLAEMLTGAVLVRETMAPDLRVQGILQGDDSKTRMVADSFPDGTLRGLVQAREGAEVELGERAALHVMRTLHNGALQQGVVPASKGGGISGALMQYFQSSEQVVSFVAVGATHDADGGVAEAGGYIVQLLPEVDDGPLMLMTERLKDFPAIDSLLHAGEAAPQNLLHELLYGMPFAEVGRGGLRYACRCSEERLLATLISLPKADIRDLVEDGGVLEIDCDYCGRHYRFAPETLRGMLAQN